AGPMAMSERERLPPEPRLQLAPGFKVDSPDGTVNLELLAPGAEFHEMRREWDRKIEKGAVDPQTGAITAMPVDAAKEKLLEESAKTPANPNAERLLDDSRLSYSDSSAGRMRSLRRR